jgi:hypothetical protein
MADTSLAYADASFVYIVEESQDGYRVAVLTPGFRFLDWLGGPAFLTREQAEARIAQIQSPRPNDR